MAGSTHKKIAGAYVRKLTRVGRRSLTLVIPAEIVDEMKLKERQKLAIRRHGVEIRIRDWKPR